MPQILYVNPAPLKGARIMAKKRRSAAQRRATAKMIAANRRRGRGTSKPRKTRARRARRSSTVVVRTSNPVRRRARRSNPRRRAVIRRRSNPTGIVGDFMGQFMPAAIGAGGALGLDVAMGMLPLPDQFKTGAMRPVARIAGAAALGVIAAKVRNRSFGNQVGVGALTVVLYDMAKGALAKVAGGKIPGIGMYEIPGIGMYEVGPADTPAMLAAPNGMGYPGSALQFPDGETEGVGEYIYG
jgi:hypothetical protein